MLSQLQLNKEYPFKEEFCKQILEERSFVYNRQSKLLLEWLENYFDYEITKKRPLKIVIHDIKKDYESFPKNNFDKRLEKREKRYQVIEDYLLDEVFENPDDKPYLSYARIAKDMIIYGMIDWDITWKTLAYNYVKFVLNKVASFIPPKVYVWRKNYEPLNQQEVDEWIVLLIKVFGEQDEENNALAWEEIILADEEKDAEGMRDVVNRQKKNYYRKAQQEFEKIYRDFPIKSYQWNLREEYKNRKKRIDVTF